MIGTRPTISLGTLFLALGGMAWMAVIRTLAVLEYGGDYGVSVAVNTGETALSIIAGIVVLSAAVRLRRRGANHRQWALLGIGVTLFAAGNVLWDWMELVQHGPVPYPGPPDVFYVTSYLFFGAALVGAAFAFRDLVDIRPAVGIAVTAGVTLLGLLYMSLLEPQVLSSLEVSLVEKILSLFYPITDVLLLIVPGLIVLFILLKLNAAELAWPWGLVVAGTMLLAASDTGFALMSAAGTYREGGLVNYGWMACHIAIAVGASAAVDVAGHQSRNTRILKAG